MNNLRTTTTTAKATAKHSRHANTHPPAQVAAEWKAVAEKDSAKANANLAIANKEQGAPPARTAVPTLPLSPISIPTPKAHSPALSRASAPRPAPTLTPTPTRRRARRQSLCG